MDSLTAINTRSLDHAFNLLLLRSEVAAAVTSIADVRHQLPVLQEKMDFATTSILSQPTVSASQVQQSTREIEAVVSRSQDLRELYFQQHLEKLEKLEKLQLKTLLAVRAASKPATLRDICDSAQPANQDPSGIPLLEPPRQIRINSLGTVQHARMASVTGKYCICPTPYQSAAGKELAWHRLNLSTKLETRGHWPSCPMSNVGITNRRAINLRYSSSASVLQAAINISFAMMSGAGGFSISPSITYHPRVNEQSDTAFRILYLIRDCFWVCRPSNKEAVMVASLRGLTRLFDEKRACPTAITDESNTLMHAAASAHKFATKTTGKGERVMGLFVDLFKTLLWYGVPAYNYNDMGKSPLVSIENLVTEGSRIESSVQVEYARCRTNKGHYGYTN
ncbi:hypothetical protein PG988_015439 [Apiospora saccharicola]